MPLDLFIVPVVEDRKVVALSVHAGVWTSAALAAPPDRIPRMRSQLAQLMSGFGFDPAGLRAEPETAGVVGIKKIAEFVKALETPRAIFAYIPAGPMVDTLMLELADVLDRGDIIVDGGNSYWGDTIRRKQKLALSGIELVDCGTSGGVEGARHGACFMVGGSEAAVGRIEPMLLDLAVPGGYVHAGPTGSGHFTKLVHNGIEFGMLQAIGEGVDLLERYHDTARGR